MRTSWRKWYLSCFFNRWENFGQEYLRLWSHRCTGIAWAEAPRWGILVPWILLSWLELKSRMCGWQVAIESSTGPFLRFNQQITVISYWLGQDMCLHILCAVNGEWRGQLESMRTREKKLNFLSLPKGELLLNPFTKN